MAIQLRRGVYNNFDPSKLLPGEVAVVQSGDPNTRNGKAVYIATLSGEIKRFAFVEDVEEIVYNITDGIAEEISEQIASDYAEIWSDVDDLKTNLLSKYNKDVLYANNLELGYYSKVNGSKQDNSSSTNYSRTKSLIPADEDTLYVGNVTAVVTCYDKDRNYIGNITVYNRTYKVLRQTTPLGTAYVGLTATNPQYFQLEKVDSGGVQSIEYPYESDSYLHIESCWCNGNGVIASTANLDLLIIQVKAGERWYVSNSSSYNLLCFDQSGSLLESTYETRSPIGKIVTVPANAKTMCVNLYRNRTKGVNSDMSDYVARLGSKKVLAIGDSITWLDGRRNYGGAEYFSGWQRQLRLAGYDVINAGWSGYPYANGIDIVDGVDYSIYKEIVTKAYDVSGYDFVILFGGTNDVLYNGALGDRPTDYSNRTFDDTKFNGAIGGIVDYIRQNNNNAKIIMASFPKSEAVSRSFANALSRVEEIKYNSLFWSCAYVDIFSELNIQPTYDAFDINFYDATHPNFTGMQKIGALILNAVKKYCY